jgi:hypothetical protein
MNVCRIRRLLGRGDARLAVSAFDGIEELLLKRGNFRLERFGGGDVSEGESSDSRRNLQDTGHLGPVMDGLGLHIHVCGSYHVSTITAR